MKATKYMRSQWSETSVISWFRDCLKHLCADGSNNQTWVCPVIEVDNVTRYKWSESCWWSSIMLIDSCNLWRKYKRQNMILYFRGLLSIYFEHANVNVLIYKEDHDRYFILNLLCKSVEVLSLPEILGWDQSDDNKALHFFTINYLFRLCVGSYGKLSRCSFKSYCLCLI